MPDRGFEIALELAMRSLLLGEVLEEDDLYLINSADAIVRAKVFENMYRRILFSSGERGMAKLMNFKNNLRIIETSKFYQYNLTIEELPEKCYVAENELEEAFVNLLQGKPLGTRKIFVLSMADDLDLLDSFGYVYRNMLSERDEELGETFCLNMFYLKSMKLTEAGIVGGVKIQHMERKYN